MASDHAVPPQKLPLQHPLFRISYTDFVEDVLGGEIGSVRNVATPQLMRYKQGGNKLSHRDTIIDVCDIWPCAVKMTGTRLMAVTYSGAASPMAY